MNLSVRTAALILCGDYEEHELVGTRSPNGHLTPLAPNESIVIELDRGRILTLRPGPNPTAPEVQLGNALYHADLVDVDEPELNDDHQAVDDQEDSDSSEFADQLGTTLGLPVRECSVCYAELGRTDESCGNDLCALEYIAAAHGHVDAGHEVSRARSDMHIIKDLERYERAPALYLNRAVSLSATA